MCVSYNGLVTCPGGISTSELTPLGSSPNAGRAKPLQIELSCELFPKNIENVKHNPGSYLVFYGSGMLESGVDRIITQVVDPKMNHTFRPQIETAIHDFLSGDRKDENSTSGPSEQAETQEPPSGCGPKTP